MMKTPNHIARKLIKQMDAKDWYCMAILWAKPVVKDGKDHISHKLSTSLKEKDYNMLAVILREQAANYEAAFEEFKEGEQEKDETGDIQRPSSS